MRRWATVPAEITRSELDEHSDGFTPSVEYAYEVRGRRYVSDQLYLHTVNSMPQREAQRQLEPYPVGRRVVARYDPQRPKRAVLDARTPLWYPIFWWGFGLFFLWAAFGFRTE
jgi:hypothetical protein